MQTNNEAVLREALENMLAVLDPHDYPDQQSRARAALAATATVAKDGGMTDRHGRMTDAMRDAVTGMSVSIDVSTGEHDSEHRLFGVVNEVMDCDGDKHGVTLLVYDTEANFTPKPEASAEQPAALPAFTPGTVYNSKTYGPLTFVGMDTFYGETSYEFREGRGRRYLLPSVMADEFAAPISDDTGNCVCGEPSTLGTVHRVDGPCYTPDARTPSSVGSDAPVGSIDTSEFRKLAYAYAEAVITGTVPATSKAWCDLVAYIDARSQQSTGGGNG